MSQVSELPRPVLSTGETPARAVAGALDLRAVSKAYRVDNKPLQVLQDISLVVKPGEFVTLVGASGCGKSTILRLVVGLDTQYQGEILLDGNPIVGPGLD